MLQKKKKKLRLKQLRLSKDLSQREVADKLSCTTLTVSSWERGAHMPSRMAMSKLAEVFPGENFFEGDEKRT